MLRRLVPALHFLVPLMAQAKDDLPLEKHIYRDAAGSQLPYRLLKPLAVEEGKKYPLVLFLHGASERGTDNAKQLIHGVPQFAAKSNREKYPCFLIAPQCPEGTRWVEVDWGGARHTQPKEPSEPGRLALELVEKAMRELPIDARRVYITGLSMGGFGTWDLLARRPELFAAGAIVCGGADEATASKIKDIPQWAFHGAKDPAVKADRSRHMIAALKKAGGAPEYTEYPDIGHNAWDPAYRDPKLLEWLFAQSKK